MSKKSAAKRVRKTSGQHFKRVKEVASEEPKPLQEKNSLKEAGEKMRSLNADRLPVASGDRLVGAVEGKFPSEKPPDSGTTRRQRLSGVSCHKNPTIVPRINLSMKRRKSCASMACNFCRSWTKICAS